MTNYFLDSSALAKRYVREPGARWVQSISDPSASNSIILTEISLAEVAAAIAAKQRAPQGISRAARDRAVGRFLTTRPSRD